MALESLHEERSKLSAKTLNLNRAIASLIEELEAVAWYDQRAEVSEDKGLKAILEHNRDEEKEHASMLIEWIRRNDKGFEKELKDYLFTDKKIAHN